jgi:2-oxoglutarate dehydrogenase E1 component
MSPKSLLRHPRCISDVSEFQARTRFFEVYDDPEFLDSGAENVKRVLYCSGKIYYDLLEKKENDKRDDVAIVRLEQLYPFPTDQMEFLMEKYSHADCYWVQEEPANMGAWSFIWAYYMNLDIKLISRKASASPATGFKKVHDQQHEAILKEAFGE